MSKKNRYLRSIEYYRPTVETSEKIHALLETGGKLDKEKAFCLLVDDKGKWMQEKHEKDHPWGTWRQGIRDY